MSVSSPPGVKEAERLIRTACAGRLLVSEPLARHTTIKVGGPADLWFEPENEAALAAALRAASETGCPVHVFGGGSNLLVPDRGMQGLTVHLVGPRFERIESRGESVVAGAGLALPLFLKFLIENGKGDCEFLAGVPAQIGGAVMMNAGSATHWIGSHVVSVRAVEFARCRWFHDGGGQRADSSGVRTPRFSPGFSPENLAPTTTAVVGSATVVVMEVP